MLNKKLIKNGKLIDIFLKNYLRKQKKTHLLTPMMYGLLSGGKKIRSNLILDMGKIFNLKRSKLFYLFNLRERFKFFVHFLEKCRHSGLIFCEISCHILCH